MRQRYWQLLIGLALYGLSLSLMIRADLGLSPWDVLHQGLAHHSGLSFGTIVVGLGVVILLGWIPLRQKPGVGTLANMIGVGVAIDLTLALIPTLNGVGLRWAALLTGVGLNGLATAIYIGAQMGPGPRDGLMTGLSARTGRSIRMIRTLIELTVLGLGLVLGGTAGAGTVLYALAIGPIVGFALPRLSLVAKHAPSG
mgnify:CR=1 FL=1